MSTNHVAARPMSDLVAESAQPWPREKRLVVLGADPVALLLLATLRRENGLEAASFVAYEDPSQLWHLKAKFPDQLPSLLQVPLQEVVPAMELADVIGITTAHPLGWLAGARESLRLGKPALRMGWHPSLRGGLVLCSRSVGARAGCVACRTQLGSPQSLAVAGRLAEFGRLILVQQAAGTLETGAFWNANAWVCKPRSVEAGWLPPNPACPVCCGTRSLTEGEDKK